MGAVPSGNPSRTLNAPTEDILAMPPNVHVVLVEPEQPRNVGSIARALANMGLDGRWLAVVEDPERFEQLRQMDAKRLAVHADDRLEGLERVASLSTLVDAADDRALFLALTARTGSTSRPHALSVVDAMQRLREKLTDGTTTEAYLVFGRESDGLTNDEVALCDWIVSIPTNRAYTSLNLSQAVLLLGWELRRSAWLDKEARRANPGAGLQKSGQRERLIDNVLALAEECGFVLPGDPHKMRPKLERVLGKMPPHIEEARTLHGFLDQVRRSLRKGSIDWKGRYRYEVFGASKAADESAASDIAAQGGNSDGIGPG